MEREKPKPQQFYKHFKNRMYQIVSIAIHSETREEMVVYQALYGDFKVYVRPLDMFMSEVDRNKYPDVRQKYRFERVDSNGTSLEEDLSLNDTSFGNVIKPDVKEHIEAVKAAGRNDVVHGSIEEERAKFRSEPYKPSVVMEKSVNEEAKELNLDPLVIEFMDADLAADKNDILSKLRPTITNDMIDIMAMSLGVVVNEGDVYDRYNDLRTCLTTMEKFESSRLRS